MVHIAKAKVISIIKDYKNYRELKVEINGVIQDAINYKNLTGVAEIGDQVWLNTTAVDLNLGTGGYHFIMAVNSELPIGGQLQEQLQGHIMKLKYTPGQLRCNCVEEKSEYKDLLDNNNDIMGMPVIIGTLHSMLAPIAATIRCFTGDACRIGYIMTDGGCLPIDFSNTVRELKNKNIINDTFTFGNSFGGDYETVNVYTALLACKYIAKCNVALIMMGPGIAGTNTRYGHTGVEQGYIIDAVNTLKGRAIAVPRISFADGRKRHLGVSHHSLTILGELTNSRAFIPIPIMKRELWIIMKQLKDNGIIRRHSIIITDGTMVRKGLDSLDLHVTTMGRDFYNDEVYFYTMGSAAKVCVNML